jgi:hypothetical protein
MSKIIVDQIQAPNAPPLNIPNTSTSSFIQHTTGGNTADFEKPRNRKKVYNYADTGSSVAHVDFPLILNTKKIRYMRIHGSFDNGSRQTSNQVFKMDFLNSSDATVVTAGSVDFYHWRVYDNGGHYQNTALSEDYLGIYAHDMSGVGFFEGTISFNTDNSSFYANFQMLAKSANSATTSHSSAEGDITEYPEKIRFFYNNASNSSKILVTPIYEP